MTTHELKRMIRVGRRVWNALTKDERDAWYYDTGTYGFIECIADILHADVSKWTLQEVVYVNNCIVKRVCK